MYEDSCRRKHATRMRRRQIGKKKPGTITGLISFHMIKADYFAASAFSYPT